MKLFTFFIMLEDYMLPCMNKKLTGFDCPGCGIQRSLDNIVHGQFIDAFKMYPAIYTLILFVGFILLNIKYKFKHSQKIILILGVANFMIILISYAIKMIFIN